MIMSLSSLRLSWVAFLKEWWAPLGASFSTYAFLLFAQPPRESAEFAYFFLLPCLGWLSFKPSLRKVGVVFFLAGFLYHMTLVGWIRHVTFPGMLMACVLLSVYNLPWFLLAAKVVPWALRNGFKSRLQVMIWLSATWVTLEWIRGQFTLGFPWCPLSVTQWERPAILQTLPWTGAWSVSFFLVFFNMALASYLHHLLVRRRVARGGFLSSFCPDFYAAVALFMAMLSPFFLLRSQGPSGVSSERLVRVGVCQPFLTNKWEGENAHLQKETLRRQTRFLSLTTPKPDLIVWPEASTPYAINFDPLWVEELARETGIPLLIGAIVKEEDRSFNTITMVSPGSGVSSDWYAKRVLVPFGEYVPYPFHWLPGLRKLVGPVGSFGKGEKARSFELKPAGWSKEICRVGSLICYEDIFPELVRGTVDGEVDFLFVCTNDAWFGKEGCAEQHAAHSVLRAIENQTPVLRCGNAGWSGWIDIRGNQREVLRDVNGSIYFEGASTLDLRIGGKSSLTGKGYLDYFLWICVSCTVWLLVRVRKIES